MIRRLLFAAVLIYASVTDIRTRTVPVHVLLFLFVIGLIGISLSSFTWALIVFVLLFSTAMVFPDFGGGDVKFGAMCAFVMGNSKVLSALLLGLLASIPAITFYCSVKHKPIKGTSFPLVPFISLGCLIMILI